MADDMLDPAIAANHIWSDALAFLRSDRRANLTERDKGWLEGIMPETAFGSTIVLCAENTTTMEMLQSKLSKPLLQALWIANGKPITPAFKIVSDEEFSRLKAFREETLESKPHTPSTPPDTLSSVPNETPMQSMASMPSMPAMQPVQPMMPMMPMQDFQQVQSVQNVQNGAAFAPATAPQVQNQQPEQLTFASALEEEEPEESPLSSVYKDSAYSSKSYVTRHLPSPMQGELPIAAAGPMPEQARPRPMGANNSQIPNMDPVTHLNKSATFDTFIRGESNKFAYTVSLAVAEGTGRAEFNPLFIYGHSGLGKTHLLNAIGNYAIECAQEAGEELSVRYVTSEEFTNEFIESLQSGTKNSSLTSEFNKRYRSVDILLIDDIQFLSGKEQTLDQFFYTFNSLQQAGKNIVITSDVVPKNLKGFEDRLISRFEQGLTVDVQPPDLETRIAILQSISAGNYMKVPDEVLSIIAERFTSNIRELEGALRRVTARANLSHMPVTPELAELALQDLRTSEVEVTPAQIINQVATYFHLTFDDIMGKARQRNVVLARQIAMYLTNELTSKSLKEIGREFNKDHSTVIHARDVISTRMADKQEIFKYVNELTARIKQEADA